MLKNERYLLNKKIQLKHEKNKLFVFGDYQRSKTLNKLNKLMNN